MLRRPDILVGTTLLAGFKRQVVMGAFALIAAEVVMVIWPLVALFRGSVEESVAWRTAVPVFVAGEVFWLAILLARTVPVVRAIQAKRRVGELPAALAATVYRTTITFPLRVLVTRAAIWLSTGIVFGGLMTRYASWSPRQAACFAACAALLGCAVNVLRALWYGHVFRRARHTLFSDVSPLKLFGDCHGTQTNMVALAVSAGGLGAVDAFLFFSQAVTTQDFVTLQLAFTVAFLLGALVWFFVAHWVLAPIRIYVAVQMDESALQAQREKRTTAIYRLSQTIPLKLAGAALAIWFAGAGVAALTASSVLRLSSDDVAVVFGVMAVIAVGACIYALLGHREVMRPLLDHLTSRHRFAVRGMRTPLSLRGKLILSFGGLIFFACSLALFWGFVQYKSLVTASVTKQAELGYAWLVSEVQAESSKARTVEPTGDLVRDVLSRSQGRRLQAAVLIYFQGLDGKPIDAFGGGPMAAPELPWYVRTLISAPYEGELDVLSLSLAGRHGQLAVEWQSRMVPLGSVAVLYPSYRGRGSSALVRPVKELFLFFLALFAACAGIVAFSVAQVVGPIRRLEVRADELARGELAEPVSSGGEADEVGRLTFALEEMRRALREKLRSTEEVNMDLERAVQMRTADLAKKNRELAETLEKLTRTQDQLVRAEKMASIGQLVAGIAHEINNPVNAIVNTVGPLGEAIADVQAPDEALRDEAVHDIKDMLRVVQRGADRTKGIVQALHNYSRTDDEKVAEVDLNRSLDDSLELLRHLIKQNTAVQRDYGEVGRIRGHAGQLNQVFMNLLTNAAQAVSGTEGATISIKTIPRGGNVEICVSDNGPGIPEEHIARVFDPFFTTKDVGEGSGLGLSIVHGIVERHGGTIAVDSEPGQGTVFTVVLPRNLE